jgi:hypothetical protein
MEPRRLVEHHGFTLIRDGAVMRHEVPQVLAFCLALVALMGCDLARESPSDQTQISGALFVNVNVDLPCAGQQGLNELSGIELTFTDATGTTLGSARTGPLQVRELELGRPGTEGWANPGCRFLAAYAVTLTPAASYRVEFTVPPPRPGPGGGYFQGIHDLVPQTVSHDELRANAFMWSFEVQPSYVVP